MKHKQVYFTCTSRDYVTKDQLPSFRRLEVTEVPNTEFQPPWRVYFKDRRVLTVYQKATFDRFRWYV